MTSASLEGSSALARPLLSRRPLRLPGRGRAVASCSSWAAAAVAAAAGTTAQGWVSRELLAALRRCRADFFFAAEDGCCVAGPSSANMSAATAGRSACFCAGGRAGCAGSTAVADACGSWVVRVVAASSGLHQKTQPHRVAARSRAFEAPGQSRPSTTVPGAGQLLCSTATCPSLPQASPGWVWAPHPAAAASRRSAAQCRPGLDGQAHFLRAAQSWALAGPAGRRQPGCNSAVFSWLRGLWIGETNPAQPSVQPGVQVCWRVKHSAVVDRHAQRVQRAAARAGTNGATAHGCLCGRLQRAPAPACSTSSSTPPFSSVPNSELRCHSPVNFGCRFSAKAASPSRRSLVGMTCTHAWQHCRRVPAPTT